MNDDILDPARRANDYRLHQDGDWIWTDTSQNGTAYGYGETQSEVVTKNVLIFRNAGDIAAKKEM
jgi:hypothetical protein